MTCLLDGWGWWRGKDNIKQQERRELFVIASIMWGTWWREWRMTKGMKWQRHRLIFHSTRSLKFLKFQLMLLIMIKQKAISACTTTQDEMMNDVIVSLTGTCVFRKWFESSFSNKFNGISSCAEGREESFSIMTSRLINTSHFGGARSMPFLHSLS